MGISVNIASHKARLNYLNKTIQCILKQNTPVDVINVYLNDYPSIPWFCQHQKVNAVWAPEGDLKASGKFYFLDKFDGYYLTVDDDLNYKSDYVGYIIDSLQRYEDKIVVGFHGTSYLSFPIKSYYYSQKNKHHFASQLAKSEWVDMLGTGTMGFHTSLGITRDVFKYPNMCDPQMMKYLVENEIPQLCLARAAGYIQEHIGSQDGYCIWKDCAYKGDKVQTEIVNSIQNYKIASHGV